MAEFSKMVENAAGKGEIALYEQFLLFPQCFQKTCVLQSHVKTRAYLGKGYEKFNLCQGCKKKRISEKLTFVVQFQPLLYRCDGT